MMSSYFADRAPLVKYSEAKEPLAAIGVEPLFDPYNPVEKPFVEASLLEILCALIPPKNRVVLSDCQIMNVPSSHVSTREDVLELENQLNESLLKGHARNQPLCPIREELFRECFDELIRQVTVESPARGVLLGRIRNEMYMNLTLYETMLCQSLGENISEQPEDPDTVDTVSA